MSEKELYLDVWQQEFHRTVKVLKAVPEDKLDFKPHEKSRTTRELAWTFVNEERVVDQAVSDGAPASPFPPAPNTLRELLSTYESFHHRLFDKLKRIPEAEFSKTASFPTGPKQFGTMQRLDVFWFLLMDMVHHRGQLSVYLRLAGDKVPSIYGPSADEPWM